ncbi:MAG: Npt1/Npt2 family nucleotide transporter [Candidatus Comchoanobacterales bacterium]
MPVNALNRNDWLKIANYNMDDNIKKFAVLWWMKSDGIKMNLVEFFNTYNSGENGAIFQIITHLNIEVSDEQYNSLNSSQRNVFDRVFKMRLPKAEQVKIDSAIKLMNKDIMQVNDLDKGAWDQLRKQLEETNDDYIEQKVDTFKALINNYSDYEVEEAQNLDQIIASIEAGNGQNYLISDENIQKLKDAADYMEMSPARANIGWLQFMAFATMLVGVLTRNIKDSFILGVASASSIGVLKIGLSLIVAVLVIGPLIKMGQSYFYKAKDRKQTKASDGYAKLFTIVMGCFTAFFFAFTFLMLPNASSIHFSAAWANGWIATIPALKLVIPLLQHWSFSLFYLAAELWTSIVFSIIFLKFVSANSNSKDTRKNLKDVLLFSNLGTLTAGIIGKVVPEMYFQQTVLWTTCGVSLSMIFLGLIIFRQERSGTILKTPTHKDKKSNGFFADLANLWNSQYASRLFMMVLANGILINFVEFCWKTSVKKLCTINGIYNASMYASYTSMMWIIVGATTILFTYFSSSVVEKRKWRGTMLILPITLAITSVTVYLTAAYLVNIPSLASKAVAASTLFIALCKSMKYGFFDPCEEMANSVKYANGDQPFGDKRTELKLVAPRLSKASGSAAQVLPMMILPSIFVTQASLIPLLTVATVFLIRNWINNINVIDNGLPTQQNIMGAFVNGTSAKELSQDFPEEVNNFYKDDTRGHSVNAGSTVAPANHV